MPLEEAYWEQARPALSCPALDGYPREDVLRQTPCALGMCASAGANTGCPTLSCYKGAQRLPASGWRDRRCLVDARLVWLSFRG